MTARVSAVVTGRVQGVGFRPFVYSLATGSGLSGWVRNEPGRVTLELEGPRDVVDGALARLRAAPPPARVDRVDVIAVAPTGVGGFQIRASASAAPGPSQAAPDLAPCAECLAEVGAAGRRAAYPFTTCARCGPRFTIETGLPYDRARTTMAPFAPCSECLAEHDDPSDRRHHAQTIACPRCGPAVWVGDVRGHAALDAACLALERGEIVACKGVGGYQLFVDATDARAVARLRERKGRPERPFAVLFANVDAARRCASVSDAEAALLEGPVAPIVLVARRGESLAEACGAGARWVGAMLPASPLHHLVASRLARPLVCTSGNASDEPICTDDDDARARLGALADVVLRHDREIARPADDSIARVRGGRVEVLRRARGLVPDPVEVADGPVVLALGAQLKSTVALAVGGLAHISQHLGDLGSVRGERLLEQTARELCARHGVRPALVACDLHPDLASTRLAERLARELGAKLVRVQHHEAHAAACLAEHGHRGRALSLVWDGMGLGHDGALWGGEALAGDAAGFARAASLRPFPLPGGDRAAREPRRAALGLARGLPECERALAALFPAGELASLSSMLERGVACPPTTSVGRLFDAVAALAGVRARCTFEAQAAIELEALASSSGDPGSYVLPLVDRRLDARPLASAVCADRAADVPAAAVSARLHRALARAAADVALASGERVVALAGGCFQSERLTTLVEDALTRAGHTVLVPARVPCHDGGVSLGQVVVARSRLGEGDHVSRAPR